MTSALIFTSSIALAANSPINSIAISGADKQLMLNDQTLSSIAINSHALSISNGATVVAHNVNLLTQGNGSAGVVATGSHSTLSLHGGNVQAAGVGLQLLQGAHATVNNSKIDARLYGIMLTNGSTVNGDNLIIRSQQHAVFVGANSNAHFTHSQFDVSGEKHVASLAALNGELGLQDANIILRDGSTAFSAHSQGRLNIAGAKVNGQQGGVIFEAQDGGQISANYVQAILSSDDPARQINTAINYSPAGADDSSLIIRNSELDVSGINAIGIDATRATGAIALENTRIDANNGVAVRASHRSQMEINLERSSLIGETLLKSGYVTRPILRSASGIILNAANSSFLQGDVDIDHLQTTNSQINLRSGSHWRGAAQQLHRLTLNDESQWSITNDSSIDHLSVSNSKVIFEHMNNRFNTLTINGDYQADRATLVFNGELGDDSSSVDKLHITGNSSGLTHVRVNNIGGSGANTLQGISIIQVDGQNNGNFTQQGRIVAGAFDYNLEKSSDEHHWILTSQRRPEPSTLNENVDKPTPHRDIPVKTKSAGPEQMIVRPEAASYIANQAAANSLFSTRMNDRAGETQYVDAQGNVQSTNLWLRNTAGHNRFNDSTGQLKTRGNRYAIQLGGDLVQGGLGISDAFHFGAMAGYGNLKSHSVSRVSGYSAKAQLHGYSAGLYGTWMQNSAQQSGAYVDSWALYNIFDNSVKGDDIDGQSYTSKGISAAVETGYSAKVASCGFWLRPQAQLTWHGVKADDVKERNGTNVKTTGENNLQTRLGVRAYFRGSNVIAQRSNIEPYLEANWLHNTKAVGAMLNGVKISEAGARNVVEIKAGVNAKLNKSMQLWVNIGQQLGHHSYRDSSEVAGVKVSF